MSKLVSVQVATAEPVHTRGAAQQLCSQPQLSSLLPIPPTHKLNGSSLGRPDVDLMFAKWAFNIVIVFTCVKIKKICARAIYLFFPICFIVKVAVSISVLVVAPFIELRLYSYQLAKPTLSFAQSCKVCTLISVYILL